MESSRLHAIIDFLNQAEKLKDTLRSGFTSGGRKESTAEHSWRLALMAMLFSDGMDDVDQVRLIKLCLVHDLGETISGDVPAPEQDMNSDRQARERHDFEKLCTTLPPDLQTEMLELWQEYSGGNSREARLAKGFDKIETILQHAIGDNPDDFDLAFNLEYGRKNTDAHPVLAEIRKIADKLTRSKIEESNR